MSFYNPPISLFFVISSIFLPTNKCIDLSINQSINQSIYLCIYLSICLSTYLSSNVEGRGGRGGERRRTSFRNHHCKTSLLHPPQYRYHIAKTAYPTHINIDITLQNLSTPPNQISISHCKTSLLHPPQYRYLTAQPSYPHPPQYRYHNAQPP